jgi:hypothetical protein
MWHGVFNRLNPFWTIDIQKVMSTKSVVLTEVAVSRVI